MATKLRKLIIFFFLFSFLFSIVCAQPQFPKTFKGWVKDENGTPLPDNTTIGMYLPLHKEWSNGTINNNLIGCNYLHSVPGVFNDTVRVVIVFMNTTFDTEVIIVSNPQWLNITLPVSIPVENPIDNENTNIFILLSLFAAIVVFVLIFLRWKS